MTKAMAQRVPVVSLATLLLVDTVVFVLEKVASNHAGGSGVAFYESLGAQPVLWVSLGLGLVQLWTWTRILAKTDISLAYPITSLSYPVTMLAATLILGERLRWQVWVGGLLITAGVLYMSGARVAATPPSPERDTEGVPA